MTKKLAKKRSARSAVSSKNITDGSGLVADFSKWITLYEEHIARKNEIEDIALNTTRSYKFLTKSLLMFTIKEYDINDGINTIDEIFINEFLEWVSSYKFNSRYGSDEYIHDVLIDFYDAKGASKKSMVDGLNEYLNQNKKPDLLSIANILNEFVFEFSDSDSFSRTLFKEDMINKFIDHLHETYSNLTKRASKATIKQRKASLLSFLTFISESNAQKHDFTPIYKHVFNYQDNASNTTQMKRKKGYSDKELMETVDRRLREHIAISRAKKEKYKSRYYCAVRDSLMALIMMYGGLRASEVLNLKFEDITEDGENYMLEIKKGKGNKSRTTVVYKEMIVAELEELRLIQKSEYISATSSTKKATYYSLYRSIKGILKGVSGVNYTGLHAFRHTFASTIASCGDIALVADLLGHNDLKTTQIYIRINDGRKKDAVAAIQKGLKQS